jgi:hypothetical protein
MQGFFFAGIIRLVSEISATDASGRLADSDAVEHRGTGADLRRILARHPPDDRWAHDLCELRRFAGEAPERQP